jgi:hypothetical protein
VQANVITSERDPHVRIELPKQVQYVGADRWILYDVADCEVHVFVEADENRNVQRLYWVQFEGFVPSRPGSQYNYKSPPTVTLAGINFDVTVRVGSNQEEPKPGSDLQHVRKLMEAKAYRLPAGMMTVRLVHVLDAQKRKELMIIYGEDVAPTGYTATDLLPGGKAYEQWPALEKDIVQRAQRALTFHQ